MSPRPDWVRSHMKGWKEAKEWSQGLWQGCWSAYQSWRTVLWGYTLRVLRVVLNFYQVWNNKNIEINYLPKARYEYKIKHNQTCKFCRYNTRPPYQKCFPCEEFYFLNKVILRPFTKILEHKKLSGIGGQLLWVHVAVLALQMAPCHSID